MDIHSDLLTHLSENPVMAAFEHAPVGVAILNPDGTVVHVNRSVQILGGYTEDEWKILRFKDIIHPGDRLAYLQAVECSVARSPSAAVVRFLGKNGTITDAELFVHIVRDSVAQPVYVIVYVRDVGSAATAQHSSNERDQSLFSEIKRNRECKYKAEQELRETVRHQQGCTFKFKRIAGEYVHTLCDGELLYRMGLTPDQVIDKTLYALLPPAEAQEKEHYYDKAWAGENVVYEAEATRADLWYLASLRCIKKEGVVQEVIASCVDITERKKTERKLVEAEEQFESLFNSSPSAIDLLDTEGSVIRVNPAHEALYGWMNAELAGKPLPIYPDNRREDYRLLTDRCMAGEPVVDFVTERVRKDGKLLTVSLTAAPLRDKEGRLFGYTGVTRDVTESNKTEELLRKADKLNVVGQLAAGLAHEIRNPLTSLRGFLQLLRAGHREKDEYYDLMLSELDRINTILSELLIIAKPQVTRFQRGDLLQMLKGVLNLLQPQAILHSIQYRTVFDAGRLSVYCSETELKQVFINIIKNGMEAMPQGGTLSVKLLLTDDDKVIVRISDQGVGIQENRIPRLGEPFYTTKEKGTGLGLMICYKIIEAHQGAIAISSKENAGTTVDVLLPLSRETGTS